MAFQYVLPHAVTSQLDSLRGRVRRVALLRGCGLFLTLSCGLLIGMVLVDFLLDLESSSRIVGFVAFCLAEAALFAFLLVRPCLIPLKDAEVASLAEERFPELGERVSSLVELSDPDIPEAEKGSPLMRDLLEEETIQELAHCDFNDAVSAQPAVRRLGYGLGTLSFLILSLLIFPSVSSLLLARLFKPWGNYESVSQLTFEIEGADEFVARGDDIEIAAKMTWRNGSDDPVPEPVELSWQSDDGNSDVRSLSFDPDRNAFTTAIPHVQDSLEFFVASAGSRSRRFRINILDRPEVLTAKLEITPPGYLGQPRELIDGVTGDITVFEQSRLVFDLTFSQPVKEASIDWIAAMVLPESELAGAQRVVPSNDDDGNDVRNVGAYSNSLVSVDNQPRTQLTVSEDGLSAKVEMAATIQGAFGFLLKESHGLTNGAEPHRQLMITRDQPPLLEVPGGEQDRARPTDVYGLRVSAVDDVALEELELHITSREGLNRVFKAPTELLGQESLEHEFRVDLADIAVNSGDFLKLQIRATDGRPIPAPNEVWSKVRYVAISDDASAQGTSDVLARQEQIRQELQDIRDQLRESVQKSDELKQDAQDSLDANQKLAHQQAVEKLVDREEQLAARIAKLAEQFSPHPLFGNLSDELGKLAADQLDPAARQLKQSTTQELKDQIATLDENSAVADMVEEGLASVASQFEKLADLEEDLLELNRIAQRANQLADDVAQLEQRRQEVASKETKNSKPLAGEAAKAQQEAREDLAENQQLLMEEQTELLASLDNLLQQRPELLEAARDHQLDKLAELARQAGEIAEPQELLAESLKRDAEQARQAAPLTEPGPAPPNSATEPRGEPIAKADSPPVSSPTTAPPAAEPGAAEPATATLSEAATNATPAEPSADANPTDGQQPGAEADSPARTQPVPPSIGELLAQQEELTAQAAQLALQTAQQAGAESPATQAAAEAAQESSQAETAARGGQFARAASDAANAEQASSATADALQESAPALAERAQQLAERQQQMAEAFEQLENSQAQRSAAQQARQEQLAAQADQVAQALSELAAQLGAQPLDLPQQGQQAESAQQSAQQGQQAASQSAQNLQAGNREQAAQSAQQAGEALRQAAQQAAANGIPTNNSSPVPGEFAAQIADAMRQLQAAQRQLSQAATDAAQSGQPSEQATGQQGESGSNQPGAAVLNATTGEAAQALPAAGESPGNEPPAGTPPAGDSAGQAADTPSSTSDAQPGPGESGQQSGQPKPGKPSSNASPNSPSNSQPVPATQRGQNNSLADAADALQQAAEMLSNAAQQLAADGNQTGDNQEQGNQQPSDRQPGLGNSGTGAFGAGEIKGPLDTELKRRAMKNWGQLSGNLKTEILQSSQRKANGDYARLIKLYFEELAKAGQSEKASD
ncbi:MAG: hypothetical protein HQ518_32155 [Rhodopirellula sp.]|nr:hypothetical protein [Rhodopirellula sp.]